MAVVGTDPKTQDVKFHLRYYWNWNEDEDFQAKVKKGVATQISSDEPMWKSTKRGIALNLDDLKEFLEADYCGLLLNTIIKKDVKKWVEEVVLYVCNQNESLIPKFFDVYKKSPKKDFEKCLKTILSDFLTEYPDVDTFKLAHEMPVIMSLLKVHLEVGLGPL